MESKIMDIIPKTRGSKTREAYLSTLKKVRKPACPSDMALKFYEHFTGEGRNVNGSVMELLICEILHGWGVAPFYTQFTDRRILTGHKFDIFLYSEGSPVLLSAKASIRERACQAVRDKLLLEKLYESPETHLITLRGDRTEASNYQRKIEEGREIYLDSCTILTEGGFDSLIHRLRGISWSRAPSDIIERGKRHDLH